MNKFFWGIFWVCLIVVLFDGYDMNIFGPVMPTMLKDLGLTPVAGGILASYAMYGMLVGSIFFGFLADKIGQKKAIILGVIIYTVFTGLIGISENQIQLAVFRFLGGIGIASVVPCILSYLTHYTPKKTRGVILAFATFPLPVGGIMAAFVALGFIESMGWRFIFLVAFIPIVMAPIVQLLLPETMLTYLRKGQFEKMKQVLKKANPEYSPSINDELELHQVKPAKVEFGSLFRKGFARNTVLFSLVYIIQFYLIFGMSTWIPNLMIQQGFPMATGIKFLLLFYSGGLVGAMIASFAAPKYGYKKFIMIYYAITAITLITISQQTQAVPLTILLLLSGATIFGQTAMVNSFASQCYPATFRSTALGLGLGLGRLGGAAGPIIGGALIGASVPIIANYLAFAIPAAVAVLLTLFTKNYTEIDINSEENVKKL